MFAELLSKYWQIWQILMDFPCGPVKFETLPCNTGGAGSIPGGVLQIPHATELKNQNIEAIL